MLANSADFDELDLDDDEYTTSGEGGEGKN